MSLYALLATSPSSAKILNFKIQNVITKMGRVPSRLGFTLGQSAPSTPSHKTELFSACFTVTSLYPRISLTLLIHLLRVNPAFSQNYFTPKHFLYNPILISIFLNLSFLILSFFILLFLLTLIIALRLFIYTALSTSLFLSCFIL